MSAESNKAMSRRFFDEAFSKGKVEVADQLFAPNHMIHGPGALQGMPKGPEGMRQFVTYYRSAFPDTQFKVEEQVAEGDTVMTRWSAKGTQKGEMAGTGIPVTGRSVTVTGVTVDRYQNGKIVETWAIYDQFGMMQQLGAIPTQGQSQGQSAQQGRR